MSVGSSGFQSIFATYYQNKIPVNHEHNHNNNNN